jgi:acyl-CoA synthetase (NDP forming)
MPSAVIGASRSRATIGGDIFHNLLNYEFAGPVYPVNPVASVVQSVTAYPSVEAIPGPVDLAVIVVPVAHVLEAAMQCGRKGVRAVVVISAGFSETGEEGRARQSELLRICRMTGMRLIGPNCMGIVNTDGGVKLNANVFAARAARRPGRGSSPKAARWVSRSSTTQTRWDLASLHSYRSVTKPTFPEMIC